MWRQDRAKPNVAENSAWEIIYDKATRKPLYYNQVTKQTVIYRPRCLDKNGGGRVSIKQPVVKIFYRKSWYKGILLGPDDNDSFLVELSDKIPEVSILIVHRNAIREWYSSPRKLIPASTKIKLLNLTSELSEDIFGENKKKLLVGESEDEEDSLSKLSDQFPHSLDRFNWPEEEKVDAETSPSSRNLTLDDLWGHRSVPWPTTEEDDESDEPLAMAPIQTFPKAQSKRRKERMNAVLLDWGEFKKVCQDDERKLIPEVDWKECDSRRLSLRMETSI